MIVAGNKDDRLAKCIYEAYPEGKFYSRTCGGFDLTNKNQRDNFINESLSHDVFISCSCLYDFNQLLLVKELWLRWVEEKHKGTIIVFGSVADNILASVYSIEKRALKEYCTLISRLSAKNGIKVTYLAPGLIESEYENVGKLDPLYLVDTIKWILAQPTNIEIQFLSIIPV